MLIVFAVQVLCGLFWAIAGLLWAVLFEVSFTKTVLAPMLLAGLLSSHVVLIWLFVSKKWAVVGWGSIDKRTRPYAIAVAMAFVVAIFPFDAVMVLHVTSNSLYMLLDNVFDEKDLPSLTFSDITPYLLVIFGVGLLLLCCWQANRLFAKCEPLMPE